MRSLYGRWLNRSIRINYVAGSFERGVVEGVSQRLPFAEPFPRRKLKHR